MIQIESIGRIGISIAVPGVCGGAAVLATRRGSVHRRSRCFTGGVCGTDGSNGRVPPLPPRAVGIPPVVPLHHLPLVFIEEVAAHEEPERGAVEGLDSRTCHRRGSPPSVTIRCRCGCQSAREPWVCGQATIPTAGAGSPDRARIAAVTVRAATRAMSPRSRRRTRRPAACAAILPPAWPSSGPPAAPGSPSE